MTTTIPNINRGRDREIICRHCKWIAAVWKNGEAGPPKDECRYCDGNSEFAREARRRFVEEEGAKFGAKVKADPKSYATEAAELARILA